MRETAMARERRAEAENEVLSEMNRLKNKQASCEEKVSLMNFRNKGYMLEVIDRDKSEV